MSNQKLNAKKGYLFDEFCNFAFDVLYSLGNATLPIEVPNYFSPLKVTFIEVVVLLASGILPIFLYFPLQLHALFVRKVLFFHFIMNILNLFGKIILKLFLSHSQSIPNNAIPKRVFGNKTISMWQNLKILEILV